MIAKLRRHSLIIFSVIVLGIPLLSLVNSYALAGSTCSTIANEVNNGANQAAGASGGCGTGKNVTTGLQSIAASVVDIISVLVGIIAVIMIIYGGFKYISSGGSSEGVSSAKNTLIYAIIGLIIVALAQIIVHTVLNESGTINSDLNTSVSLVAPKQ